MGPRAWLLSLAALVVIAAVVLGSVRWLRPTPTQPKPARPVSVPQDPHPQARAIPQGGVEARKLFVAKPAISPPVAPTASPSTSVSGGVPPAEKGGSRTDRIREPSSHPATISPRPKPASKTPRVKPPADELSVTVELPADEPQRERPTSVEVPPLPPPTPRVTITAPAAGERVGSSVQVQGSVEGLGDHRIFLCIRQPDRRIYPRGELFPKAGGQWAIPLRSSKEKTFEILVVSSHSKEASQVLSDQTSRDDGLATLPPGAVISSGAVSVQRKRALFGIS
jgi:hypothetical protein